MTDRKYVHEGEVVELLASYSEAAVFTRIGGKRVMVALHRWHDGEMYVPLGSPDGHGLTMSEIGFFRVGRDRWYIPEEHLPPRRSLEDALAAHTGVIVLGPLSHGEHMSVGEVALYVDGRCVETVRQFIEHATAERGTAWRLEFMDPAGKPRTGTTSGGRSCALTALIHHMIHVHGGHHSEIGVHLAQEVTW
ncbi:hypothetical protein [Microbispora sp. NBRC 16548]|uniref:hypothetical protein n=1 Tax=Microbispora sp. NBRC 16548 TaxID=3030994 RepID=UPI0024A0D7BD|nr:hypothetical protein [Microbispora sp. NBRC 16548]GLX06724.1 hypothetical protein Misp03_36510 [Microbispora sp. NBRC 16548]